MPEKAKPTEYLSDVASDLIMVICEDCEILHKVNCYKLLAEHGDMTMPAVLTPVARSLNCPRVDNQYYDRCRLHYHFSPDEWARKMGYVKAGVDAQEDRQLADLSEWQRLRAGCRACGHTSEIDRWRIERRYGKEMSLSQIAARLTCQRCTGKRKGYIEVTSAKRD